MAPLSGAFYDRALAALRADAAYVEWVREVWSQSQPLAEPGGIRRIRVSGDVAAFPAANMECGLRRTANVRLFEACSLVAGRWL